LTDPPLRSIYPPIKSILHVTEAGADDLGAVRRILVAANEQYRAVLPATTFDPYLAMVLDLEPRLEVASVLVADEVATVTFFPDGRDEGWGGDAGVAGIRSMGVDPAARGRGLGVTLLDECARRARALGAHAIALHTADWLPAAIRLYERYGFVREPGRDIRAVEVLDIPPDEDFVALAYRLDLEGSPVDRQP
jgi:ribosomal protein S18 acetylase RimI-like enzyme